MKFRKKKLSLVITFALIFVVIAGVIAFSFTTSTYNGRGKFDFGGAGTNATSTSFTQRFIFGAQPVSRYTTSSFSGRLGILDDAIAAILNINITYPNHLQEFVRGSSNESGEDDLDHVPDVVNLTAQVYNQNGGSGISGAICFFYDNNTLLGNSTTNSSGDCNVEYDKTNYNTIFRNLKVNYTAASSLGTVNISSDNNNASLVKYVAILTMSNLRDNGKYYDGDEAVLLINIKKTNSSDSNLLYTPINVSAHAKNSAGASRGLNYYPGNVSLASVGNFATNVTLTYGAGAGSFIKWEVNYSDDSYITYIGSALHADEDVCLGDFGAWSSWSACASSTQTRTRTDSSSCTEVGTQSCTGGGGGGGGDSCSNVCSSGSVQDSCVSGYEGVQARTCGDFDSDPCTEWGPWSITEQCLPNEICQNTECVETCQEVWSCTSWSECSGGSQSRSCLDLNSCGTTINEPSETRSCNGDNELPPFIILPDGSKCWTDYFCEDWGVCEATYGFSEVLGGQTEVLGLEKRTCYDQNLCTLPVVQSNQCDFRVPIVTIKTKWCYEDYIEIYDVAEGQLLGRLKEEAISEDPGLTKFDALFVGVIGSEFTGYCSYCHDGVKNYDEEGLDCGGPNCPSCKSLLSFWNWLPISIWSFWILFILGLIAGLIEERREISRIGDRATFGIGSKMLMDGRREKEFEGRIFGGIRRLGIRIPKGFTLASPRRPSFRLPKFGGEFRKIELREERELERLDAIERRLIDEERAASLGIRAGVKRKAEEYGRGPEFKFEAVGTRPQDSLLNKLKRKLKLWKRKGYYGTARLENKIESYELRDAKTIHKEEFKFKRFVAGIRKRRLEAKTERSERKMEKKMLKTQKIRKDKGKSIFRLAVLRIRGEIKKQKKAVRKEIRAKKRERIRDERERIRDKSRIEEKKIIEEKIRAKILVRKTKLEKKIFKKDRKARKKVVKVKIRSLRREVRNRKLLNLMKKLRLWKKEGYYGTAALEAKIDRLKRHG